MTFGKFGVKVWVCLNLGVIVEGSKPLPFLVTPCIYTPQSLPFCFDVFNYDFHIITCWLQYIAITWLVFNALWAMVIALIFEVHGSWALDNVRFKNKMLNICVACFQTLCSSARSFVVTNHNPCNSYFQMSGYDVPYVMCMFNVPRGAVMWCMSLVLGTF